MLQPEELIHSLHLLYIIPNIYIGNLGLQYPSYLSIFLHYGRADCFEFAIVCYLNKTAINI